MEAKKLDTGMNFSFRNWLEEYSAQSEMSPPPGHDGPGLICFDFDKTLTTAMPKGGRLLSTANPNEEMINKLREHKRKGNYCIIVTGRGVDVDAKETGESVSVYKAIKDWGISNDIDEVILTGGAGFNDLEDKAPKILSTMRRYKTNWGILYDDNKKNVATVNMHPRWHDVSLRGILVTPKKEAGFTPAV